MTKLIGKLNSIVLAVSDMDKSVKFYRDVLGMNVSEEYEGYVELKAGTFYVGLYVGKPDKPAGGALPVFEVDDIKKIAKELKKKKVKFVDEPYEEDYGFLAIFQDPDGYLWELFQEK
jgi:lactoylglutathione lyase